MSDHYLNKKELKKEKKKNKTEINIIKEICELREDTNIMTDNIDELIQKMRKCGELIEQLEQGDPKFYEAFLTAIKENK